MAKNIKKETPDRIKRWNWGAFVFGWIWGIFNEVWISLLTLIPFVNLVMIFVLGAKGNQWAWEKSDITDVDVFLQKQRKWNIAAAIFAIIWLLAILAIIGACSTWMYDINSGATKEKIFNGLNNDRNVTELLGSPVEKDSIIGSKIRSKILRNGEWGTLSIYEFDAKGSKITAHITEAWLKYKNKESLVYLEITPKNEQPKVLIGPDPEILSIMNELMAGN